MKRNLFAIGLIATSFQLNAQDLTYISKGAKFYVEDNTLVYSGGNLVLDSDEEKTVENKGNIIIVGDYKKGTKTTAAADDGKEFVNVYTGDKNYGQLQILGTDGSASNGRVTTQWKAASNNYFGTSFAISFPFRDNVSYLMKSFGLPESDFKGDCKVDTDCGGQKRYTMTLTKWNNKKVQHDAVPTGSTIKAGDYYNLNLRQANMQAAMKDIINYKGNPAPQAYQAEGKHTLHGMSETDFGNLEYNDWKNRINPYAEAYKTYMGDADTRSKVYNKNVYRFGNPFTSNVDLSDFEGEKAWLKILNGGEKNLKEAIVQEFIRGFFISKRTKDYDINWSDTGGSINSNADYHKASFDGNVWSGSAEALILRPTETFNLNFTNINTRKIPNRVLNVRVNFNDKHKTFAHVPSASEIAGNNLSSKEKSNENITLKNAKVSTSKSVNNKYNFVQAEIFLINNNTIIADPAYLVGTNYATPSGNTLQNTNGIYVFGIKDDQIEYNSKKDFNEFNSQTYIAKPLGIGFNNLKDGENYELRFNLYEGSIFNSVKNIEEGSFFIVDNNNKNVTEIASDKVFTFTAEGDMNKRFEIYWKETPITLSNTEVESIATAKTLVYTDKNKQKIRFEKSNDKATIEILDMVGRLISSEKNVNTSHDYILNLTDFSAYIIQVKYSDGVIRTLKVVK